MDESALRSALASVNDCSSSLHREFRFWTFLVVVGVALELAFVIWEYVEELHDFRRGIVHPPDSPNRLLFAFGFFAAGLVALGVGGELNVESKINTVETCIRKGNDMLFLVLSKEAGDAAKSAETARDEADAASKEAHGAELSAKNAERELEKAKRVTAQLRQDVFDAEVKLDDERNKRAELEKSVAPRSILIESVAPNLSTVDPLRPFHGMHFIIECIPDWEARRAAGNIESLLKKAEWTEQSVTIVDHDLPDGVSLNSYHPKWDQKAFEATGKGWSEPEDKSDDGASELRAFLEAYDWQADSDWNEKRELGPNTILIKVGFKPAPYFAPELLKELPTPVLWDKQKIDEVKRHRRRMRDAEDRIMRESKKPKPRN